MKADHFSYDVRQFLRLLAEHEVRYLVIGGIAVVYHGYARLTSEVDFYFDGTADNVSRLWKTLVEFWDGDVPGLASADDLAVPGTIVQFGTPPNRIDLIRDLSLPFDEAWAGRVEETVHVGGRDVPVSILGLRQLRQAKQAAGRPKDLDDLAHLPEAQD